LGKRPDLPKQINIRLTQFTDRIRKGNLNSGNSSIFNAAGHAQYKKIQHAESIIGTL
jgi:hypothetical protein